MGKNRLFAWQNGRLREVKRCWVWLFRLLQIGFIIPPEAEALCEVMNAMETYNRKCQIYFKASGVKA